MQIYVINLETRPERLDCVKHVLEDSPYPWERFEAVKSDNFKEKCPHMEKSHMTQGGPAQGVYCSNFKIWEKELAHGTSDFVIVLEDDIVFTKDVWTKVDALLNNECQNWDFIAVDTFHIATKDGPRGVLREAQQPHGAALCKNITGPVGVYNLRGAGAHMQIIRRSALEKLIEMGKEYINEPVDKVIGKRARETLRLGMYAASIAAQFKSAEDQFPGLKKPKACKGKGVGASDIKR